MWSSVLLPHLSGQRQRLPGGWKVLTTFGPTLAPKVPQSFFFLAYDGGAEILSTPATAELVAEVPPCFTSMGCDDLSQCGLRCRMTYHLGRGFHLGAAGGGGGQ